MTLFALLLACGSGKVVLDPTGTPDDDGAVDDTGPSGDEGGSSGGDSGGDSGGSSGGSSSGGSSSGGDGSGSSSGSDGSGSSSGGGDTGEPPGPDYAGSYVGTIAMEVPDWRWECQSDFTLEVDESGGFDQAGVCAYDSDWGTYETPVTLRGTTDADGAVTGLATIEMYGYGDVEADITGTLGDGQVQLAWEADLGGWGGDSTIGTGAFKGSR